MAGGGLALKGASSFIRALQFLSAAFILGVFSYFLAHLHRNNQGIPKWEKAVEGISGAAVIYTAFAVIFTCFLGGITIFSALGILLDLLFLGGFIAIAILGRGGLRSCKGSPNSIFGQGYRKACKLEKGVFVVAVIGAVLFFISLLLEILLNRRHKKQRAFGPSPGNGYTSGSEKKPPFWKRQKKTNRDAELGAAGIGAAGIGAAGIGKHHNEKHDGDLRASHDTALTGSTAAPTTHGAGYGGPNNRYSATDSQVPLHKSTLAGPTPNPGYTTLTPDTKPDVVVHDHTPYAEVHHKGHPHTHPESEQYGSGVGHHGYGGR